MNRLRELRIQAHLSQTRLAKMAGLTQNTISRIELDRGFHLWKTKKKIASVLEVTPSEIFAEPYHSPEKMAINCRWCHGQIAGLYWHPAKYELTVGRMPRAAKVHKNGFFYHEDCLKEKLRIDINILKLAEK